MLIKNGTNLGKPLKSLLVRGLDAKLQLGCCTWSKNWVVEWTWFLNRAAFNWAKGRIYSLTFCSWTSTKANQFTFQHQVNFWPRAAAKRGNFRGKKQRSLDVHDVRNQAQLCSVTRTARYLCNLRRNVAKMQFSSNQPSPAEEWVGTHCLCHDCNKKNCKSINGWWPSLRDISNQRSQSIMHRLQVITSHWACPPVLTTTPSCLLTLGLTAHTTDMTLHITTRASTTRSGGCG